MVGGRIVDTEFFFNFLCIYIFKKKRKKGVNQALLSNRASCLNKHRVFASNGGAEVSFYKIKKKFRISLIS